MGSEKEAEAKGRESGERGERFEESNDYRRGSREWFAFEDARREAGGPELDRSGIPAWG